MMQESEYVEMTRKQLYDEIWELSVSGVADKYHLVYTKLIVTCKQENIPYPSSGYWTKKNMGKDVSDEVAELTGSPDKIISLIKRNEIDRVIQKKDRISIKKEYSEPKYDNNILSFLHDEKRMDVLKMASSLEINDKSRLHSALIQYKKRITEYNKRLKEAQSKAYYNPRVHKPADEPSFFKEVSDDGMKRSIAILDVLFKAVEKLGGSVNDDLSMNIRSDTVRIRVAEGQNQVAHELTKEEAKALVKYKDEVKRYSWASKPQIRKYDRIYNGRLRIVFGERRYIRDGETEKLEDRLGDILIVLYEKSEELRIERERREEEARRRAEEERIKEEKRERRRQEAKKTISLQHEAEDYRIAMDIRGYVQAMIDAENEKASPEWIAWANRKADWFDPSIAYQDDLLGTREHQDSMEDKEKALNDSIRHSWYW